MKFVDIATFKNKKDVILFYKISVLVIENIHSLYHSII
jgi:hypothetical protein